MVAVIARAPVPTTGRSSEGGHWYTRDGKPAYEIPSRSGAMRPVTLRDARALNLVPSVSTIIGMEAKPALTNWMVDQALLAALTLPRAPNEDDTAFMARAKEDSKEQARRAADRGTRIHAMVQGHFEGAPCDAEEAPFVFPVRDWLAQRFGTLEWLAEQSFAHSLGFGGKSDLICHAGIVVDFKCKDFGPEKDADDLAYPEHVTQLAAYAQGFGYKRSDCLNIFISTRIPGLIRVREWDADEIEHGWEAFRCLLRLWQIRRNYESAF